MKISVELSDSELTDICRFAGTKKKGPAVRKLVADALMLKRRELVARKFLSGQWGAELEGYEAGQAADRKKEAKRDKIWRK